MYDADKRKLLSILCHGSIFLSTLLFSVGVPILIWFISDDRVVRENAKEAINFHFNVWFYGAIILVLSILTLGLAGFVLAPIGYVIHWGLTILAVLQCLGNSDESYRYPFIFRLI